MDTGISSTVPHDGDFVDARELQYLYDGNGRRVQKIFAGTATADQDVYFNEDFQALETRWNGSTNAYEQHVWDLKYIDAPILRYRDANGHTSSTSTGDGTSEEVLYFTFDANFNITGLVQENQTFVERYVYTPYGERLVLTGTFGSRGTTSYDQQLGHQGLYTDVESGTIYNRGRQGYHPGLGNFTQRDPIVYSDSMNLYQPYGGNPITFTDPSGQSRVDFLRREVDTYSQKLLRLNVTSIKLVMAKRAIAKQLYGLEQLERQYCGCSSLREFDRKIADDAYKSLSLANDWTSYAGAYLTAMSTGEAFRGSASIGKMSRFLAVGSGILNASVLLYGFVDHVRTGNKAMLDNSAIAGISLITMHAQLFSYALGRVWMFNAGSPRILQFSAFLGYMQIPIALIPLGFWVAGLAHER